MTAAVRAAALLMIGALAGCGKSKASCADRVARLRARLAAPSGGADKDLPVTFSTDGIGRTPGAFAIRVTGDYDQVSVNGDAPRALPAVDVVTLAHASGAKVIELELPHDMSHVLGYLVGELSKVGELHLLVAHVKWPHDAGSPTLDALEAAATAGDTEHGLQALNGAFAQAAGSCLDRINGAGAAAQGASKEQAAQDAVLRAKIPEAVLACDCALDVETLAGIVEIELFPHTELGWLRVTPGANRLDVRAVERANQLVDSLANLHADGRARGVTLPY
jgi:hypothetical protein